MNLRSGSQVGQGVLAKTHQESFQEGVTVIMSKWTSLQLAVEQEWGGRNSEAKAWDMINEVVDWFYRHKSVQSICPVLCFAWLLRRRWRAAPMGMPRASAS